MTLRVDVDGNDRALDGGEVHYLLSDGQVLRLSANPPDEGAPVREMGYFASALGRWFFHAANLPAARVLRIDGRPVTNLRQELRSGHATVRLLPGVHTGPRNPRSTGASTAPSGGAAGGTDGGAAGGTDGGRRRRGPRDRRRDGPGPRDGKRYVIGRAGTNADIEIDDPQVRVAHATLRVDAKGRWWIFGPVFVDGVRQMSATLSEGDTFVIGQTVVTVSPDLLPPDGRAALASPRTAGPARAGTEAPARPRTGGPHRRPTNETGLGVELDRVTVYGTNGRTRLDDVSLSIAAGEMVAVVGPSGAGKSSLINVLLGELAEDSGTVRIGPAGSALTGGRTDPDLRRRLVRYVPQADALYDKLSVRETLTFAARLRAAPDTSPREIADRVSDVLGRLTLDAPEHPVDKLSGGQRRRVSIGLELVGEPKLLLLDEPTSGLDPGKDRAIMRDLRQVSETKRCTVIVVTHATEHLAYADKLVVVAKGGRVRYVGEPAGALAALGQASWADLMLDLDREPPPRRDRGPSGPSPRTVPTTRMSVRGFTTLLSRQLTLVRRRGKKSHLMTLLTPLLCTVIAVLASSDGLRPGPKLAPVLAILVTVAALSGAALTYLDLVHDFEVLRRDWRVGVEVAPMVLAKTFVFGGVCAVLSTVVAVTFAGLSHLPDAAYSVPPLGMLVTVIFLIMAASMGSGLLISALAPSPERAVTVSTQLAVLQVTLSGALFHLPWGLTAVSSLLPARLGLAAVASYTDLNRHRKPFGMYQDWLWAPGAARFWGLLAGLALITTVTLVAAVVFLQRRWRQA